MSKIGKFRRLAFVAFFALALFALVFALAGCNNDTECAHEHTTTATTATCTQSGTTTITCDDCHTVLSTVEVAALGHDYVADESRCVTASCTSEGKEVSVCSRCGDVHEVTTEKTLHTYIDEVTEPTCTTQGYTTHTCSQCGYSYVGDYKAAAHHYEEEVTEPTCTTQGYTTYTCSDCHDTYTASYVSATGHSWDNSAACADKHCTTCGASELASASHTYSYTSTTATCTADGKATYTCSACGDSYETDDLAHGHTYTLHDGNSTVWVETDEDPVAVTNKTCVYTCTHMAWCNECQAYITEKYEVEIHDYALAVQTPATCQTAGTKVMKCTHCYTVLEGSDVSYSGEHSYGEGTTENGCTTYTCATCSSTKLVYNDTSATVTTTTLANDIGLSSGTVISMSQDAVDGLDSSANLTLSATTSKVDALSELINLSAEDIEKVGESDVYSITLEDGSGDYITNFDGSITVKIPYTLSTGEDQAYITIYYLSGDEIVTVDAEYTDGYVVFTTTHFSYYTVGKYTAAEVCQKYGHNIKVLSKDPTCTEAGYYIEICTRCNQTLVNQIKEALGHNFNHTVVSEATCTEHGEITYVCSLCNSSYTGVIEALGHTWELQEESCVAATCTHAGHNDYKCATCGATYTADLLQLSHDYTAVVTAPTCTQMGYTTYTCSMCGNSYVTDYVAANGHSWDSDAACADKVCLICGETMPATAAHSYVDGICSVCGYGCDHNYVLTVVAPTCTEYGYTIKECSKCHSITVSDYVEPLGHTYTTDLNKCDVCGSANPDITKIFNALIENSVSYDYTLALTDVTLNVSEEYSQNDESQLMVYKVDAAYLYISLADNKVIFYGTGTAYYENTSYYNGLNYEEAYTADATIYGDGEYAYIYIKLDGTENEEMTLRASYEYALGDYYDTIYDMLFSSEDMLAQYYELAEESLGAELYQNLLTIANNNSSLANEIAAQIFATLYNGKVTDSGYEFTLEINLLGELDDNLYNLTVSQLMDKYLGEGTLSSIKTYLSSIENKTVYQMVTDILVYGEDYGITKDIAFTAINTLVTLYTGAEFDIEAILTSTEEEAIGSMTMSEIVYEMTGEEYSKLIAMLDQLGEMNIYAELLDSDVAEYLHSTISELANGEAIAIKLITDKNYAITSVQIVLDDAVYTNTINNAYVSNGTVTEMTYSTTEVTMNGTLSILFSCDLPANYSKLKTDTDGMYSEVIAALKAACNASAYGTLAIDSNHTVGVNKDGSVYLVYTYDYIDEDALYAAFLLEIEEMKTELIESGEYTEEEFEQLYEENYWNLYYSYYEVYCENYTKVATVTITDISKADYIEIGYDCADCYYIYCYFDNYSGHVSLDCYVDTKNNVVSRDSFHDYVLTTAPEGVPTTADEVECGQYYYTYYKCSECGEVYIESHRKYHYTHSTYTLLDGSESCEDGVYVQYICEYCGYITNSYTIYYHHSEDVELFTIYCNSDTHNGYSTYYHDTCACGEYSYYWHSSYYGCEFNEICDTKYINVSSSGEYTSDEADETTIGQIDYYNCYYTGCQNYYTHKYYYCSNIGDDVYTYYQYEDGEWTVCGTYSVEGDLHIMDDDSDSYTESGSGYTVYWNSYSCVNCGYGEKWTNKYNSNGYRVYEGYEETDSNGNVTYSYYYEYVRDSSGNVTESKYYKNGEYQYTYTSNSYYNDLGGYTYVYSYIYADGSTSTETQKYDSYGREVSYNYTSVSADGSESWSKWSYTFVSEDDPCYAVYEYSNSNGSSSLYYTHCHAYSEWVDHDNGTCTQPYTYGWHCNVCDEDFNTSDRVNGHSWYYDSEKDVYVCDRCGLESENGSSSNIYLEDMTYNSTYGASGCVSIGYYYQGYDSADVDVSFYFVPAGSQDNLELTDESYIELTDLNVTIDGNIMRISLEELYALAEENNISLYDYDLRVSFNAYNSDDVTSITITDLTAGSVVSTSWTFSEYVCTDYEGNDTDTVDSRLTEMAISTTITFGENGEATIATYTDGSTVTDTCEYVQRGYTIIVYTSYGTEVTFTMSYEGSVPTLTSESQEIYISGSGLTSNWVYVESVYTATVS